jgi:hypothetical protein
MSQQASVLGRVALDVPPPITPTPKYRGVLRRHQKASEAAIDAAYAGRDVEALRWAICGHISRNSELAERVSSEILRKLPWHPCEKPLTPYDEGKPLSHLVNWLAGKRYHDIQRMNAWSREGDVALDSYNREPALYNMAQGEPAEHTLDDTRMQEFLGTLSAEERELAEECLSKGSQAKGFMAIVHRAEDWASRTEPRSVCGGCYSCSERPWTRVEALRLVEELGVLPATCKLFRGLPRRRARPAGWWMDRIHTPRFSDKWGSKGRSHATPKSTSPDEWKVIPAKLYHQVMSGTE